jgi:hypothetical protein
LTGTPSKAGMAKEQRWKVLSRNLLYIHLFTDFTGIRQLTLLEVAPGIPGIIENLP